MMSGVLFAAAWSLLATPSTQQLVDAAEFIGIATFERVSADEQLTGMTWPYWLATVRINCVVRNTGLPGAVAGAEFSVILDPPLPDYAHARTGPHYLMFIDSDRGRFIPAFPAGEGYFRLDEPRGRTLLGQLGQLFGANLCLAAQAR